MCRDGCPLSPLETGTNFPANPVCSLSRSARFMHEMMAPFGWAATTRAPSIFRTIFDAAFSAHESLRVHTQWRPSRIELETAPSRFRTYKRGAAHVTRGSATALPTQTSPSSPDGHERGRIEFCPKKKFPAPRSDHAPKLVAVEHRLTSARADAKCTSRIVRCDAAPGPT